jgi:heme/copper-type cytochrome/quinol oxidase subunit 4
MFLAISKRVYQRQIPIILISFISSIIIIEYFANIPFITAIKNELVSWPSAIYAFTLLFGYLSLILNLFYRLMQRKRDKVMYTSGIKLGVIAVFVFLGLLVPGGIEGSLFSTLYKYIVSYPALALETNWILFCFYAYRYLRVSSRYTIMMLIAFMGTLLRELPVLVSIYPPSYDIGAWIAAIPASAAQRAALAATGIGILILVVRAIVRKEPGLIEVEA